MAISEDFKQTLDKITAFLPVKEIEKWGYTWGGMIPINLELAMYLVSHDASVPVYQLHYDNTESQINEKEDMLTDYTVTGDNIYGVDREEWDYFIKSEDNQQLIEKFVPLQGAWDGFMRYLEEYKGDIGYNTRGYGPVREHLMDMGFSYDDLNYLIESYRKHYGYKFTDFSNREELQIVYRHETLNNVPPENRMTSWNVLSGSPFIRVPFSNAEISKRASEILADMSLDSLNLKWENFLPVRRDYINNHIDVDIRALINQARKDINNSSKNKWHCKLADPRMPDTYIALTLEKSNNTVEFTAEFTKENIKTDVISIEDIPLGDFMENKYTVASIIERVELYGDKNEEGVTRLCCYTNDLEPTPECVTHSMSVLTKMLPLISPDTRQYDSENKRYNVDWRYISFKEEKIIASGTEYNIVDEWLSGDDVYMIAECPDHFRHPDASFLTVVNGEPFAAFGTLPERSEVISRYEDDLAAQDIDLAEKGLHIDTTYMTPSRKRHLEHYLNAICHSELHKENSKYPYLRDTETLKGYFPLKIRAQIMDIIAYGHRLKDEDITNVRCILDDTGNSELRHAEFAVDIHGMPDIIYMDVYINKNGIKPFAYSKSGIELRLPDEEQKMLCDKLTFELVYLDAESKIVRPPEEKTEITASTYIPPSQEELAKEFVAAIKKMAQSEDSLDNFESYLTHSFSSWLKKYASTPEGITDEMKHFADIGAKVEEAEKIVGTGKIIMKSVCKLQCNEI